MIVVNLMGGLGNQMFQYALGRKLSMLQQTMLFLDCTFLNTPNPLHIKREYELDIFKIQAKTATVTELKEFESIKNNPLIRKIYQWMPGFFSYHLVTEKGHAFDPAVLKAPINSWVNGFWQTEKYFSDIADVIRSDFEFKLPSTGLNKTLSEKIRSCESLGIHIRRGDYTNPDIMAYHGMCSENYYYDALEIIRKKATVQELFIFSDDMEWVNKHLKFDLPTTTIIHNTGKNSFEDMRLMSLCKHNIVANSSFSWWGAWLNRNKNKVVIAPKVWIADKNTDTKDVVPENWIRL